MISVIGATGSTGIGLVGELVKRGERVRAAARDTARLADALRKAGIEPGSVELVACDLEKPDTFGAALANGAACYVAVGGPAGTPQLVDVECRFIDAAKRAGVSRYVKVSGVDARPDSPARIQRWHGTIGEHLLQSGLACTILEPSFFMQNFLGLAPAIMSGVLPLPTGDAKAGLIDARDISRVAAAVLTGSGHDRKRYVLTGPELLSHADAAAQLSRVLERPVAFVDVPEPAFAQSLKDAGLPPWFAELLADVYGQMFRIGAAARTTDDVEQLTGRKPGTLATFLRDHRAAFV